jgi:hypothetical protein
MVPDRKVWPSARTVSLPEARANTPTGKKREATHVVCCETEIYRISILKIARS